MSKVSESKCGMPSERAEGNVENVKVEEPPNSRMGEETNMAQKSRGPNGWKRQDIVEAEDTEPENIESPIITTRAPITQAVGLASEKDDKSDQMVPADSPEPPETPTRVPETKNAQHSPPNTTEDSPVKKPDLEQRANAAGEAVVPIREPTSELAVNNETRSSADLSNLDEKSIEASKDSSMTATDAETSTVISVHAQARANKNLAASNASVHSTGTANSKSKRRARRRKKKILRMQEAKLLADQGLFDMGGAVGPMMLSSGQQFYPSTAVHHDGNGNYFVQTPHGFQPVVPAPAHVNFALSNATAQMKTATHIASVTGGAARSRNHIEASHPATPGLPVPPQRHPYQTRGAARGVPTPPQPTPQIGSGPQIKIMLQMELMMREMRMELAIERQERKRIALEHSRLLNALVSARNIENLRKSYASPDHARKSDSMDLKQEDSETASIDSRLRSKGERTSKSRSRETANESAAGKGFVTPLSSQPGSPSESVQEEASPSEPANTKSGHKLHPAKGRARSESRADMESACSYQGTTSDTHSVRSGFGSVTSTEPHGKAQCAHPGDYSPAGGHASQYYNSGAVHQDQVTTRQMQYQQAMQMRQLQAQIQMQAQMQAQLQRQLQQQHQSSIMQPPPEQQGAWTPTIAQAQAAAFASAHLQSTQPYYFTASKNATQPTVSGNDMYVSPNNIQSSPNV